MNTPKLTQADMIVLSLLIERPMHGYDLVQEYDRQEIRDWASVSKAQVYYALKKLDERGLVVAVAGADDVDTRGKTVYTVTNDGKMALEVQLADDEWVQQRRVQPFATWTGLSMHCSEAMRRQMVNRRRAFLQSELQREQASYDFVANMTSERSKAGLKIIALTIALIKTELTWIETVVDS